MLTRKEIKQRAKAQVTSNHYWYYVGMGIVLMFGENGYKLLTEKDKMSTAINYITSYDLQLDSGRFDFIIGIAILIFLLGPLVVGARHAFLNKVRDDDTTNVISDAFSEEHYLHNMQTMFYYRLIVGIGYILFVIPGIIWTYKYYFVPYIAIEHPELSAREVLDLSKTMTEGRKMDLFLFDLSFIGWVILGMVSVGIAYTFYVGPYYYLAQTELYNDYISNGYDPLLAYKESLHEY